VHTTSAAGEVEFISRNTLAYFGKSNEELKDWSSLDIVHPDDLPRVIESWSRSIETGEDYGLEQRNRRADGVFRWFQSRGHAVRNAAGEITAWYWLNTDIDERKKAEEALRSSQRELSGIIETMPGLVWCASPDGELSYVNRRILDYVGVEKNQLLSGGWADFLYPDDVASVVAAWSHSVASGEAFEVQARLRGADGTYRWFHSLSQLGRDTEGNPARWYGVMIDVDDRKRAEDKVEQAYLRLAEAQQLSKTGSFITDLLVDDHNWSEEAFRIFEFDPATKVTVKLIRDMVHPEDLQSFDSVISRGAAGEDVDFIFRIVTPQGAMKHIRGVARVMERVAGRPLFIGALQDVTQSKIEEERVRRSEAFLAEAQRLTRIGSFSWRVENNDIRWSDELYRIFEFEPDVPVTFDLIGNRVHPDDLPLMSDMIVKAQSAADHLAYEHRIVMPDHSIKHLHLTAHSRRDPEGRLEYIGAVQDVTQRHLAEASLARARAELANAAKISSLGVLTASIAHEVNQPLSGIITNANTCIRMLERDSPNLDGVREMARLTLRDGKRASDVILRLRALFAKKEFAREPVDLTEAAREVIVLSMTDLERNRVILRTEFAGDLPRTPGDRIQLQQVISNLLRNASEAMSTVDDRPRLLRVAIQPHPGGQVCLSVADAGVGLVSEGMDRLFEPFYTTKSHGMGIGLSVSRSIIESHEGRLWATPNEGPGTTFSFSIPAIMQGVRE
jgi:PAS domain S-box-containing protein